MIAGVPLILTSCSLVCTQDLELMMWVSVRSPLTAQLASDVEGKCASGLESVKTSQILPLVREFLPRSSASGRRSDGSGGMKLRASAGPFATRGAHGGSVRSEPKSRQVSGRGESAMPGP